MMENVGGSSRRRYGKSSRYTQKIVVITSVFVLLIVCNLYRDQNKIGRLMTSKSVNLHCCQMQNYGNTGHLLTENVLDLYRCGRVVVFAGRSPIPTMASSFHFSQIADILHTKVKSMKECTEFYKYNNTSFHPEGARMAAYSQMSSKFNPNGLHWDYDAIEVANGLRYVQMKVLLHCGMNTSKYKDFQLAKNRTGTVNDGDLFEQLVDRSPSTSVTIVRRDTRVLLDVVKIYSMCQGLNLTCRIINTSTFFKKPKAKDLCFVLKKFESTVTIGAMGAELIYPYYTYGTTLLHIFDLSREHAYSDKSSHAYRFGNHIEEGEEQIIHNLIRKHSTNAGIDRFFSEFSAHFGNKNKAIRGALDNDSLYHVMISSTQEACKVNPYYCADIYSNETQLRIELKTLIADGNLLTKNTIS